MDKEEILKFVKYNLGLSTNVRDDYLNHIIDTSISRLKRAGIDPESQDKDYERECFSYIVDEVSWMYRNRGGETALPTGLRQRRNTLIVEQSYEQ